MQVTLPCEVYARLASVALTIKPTENRAYLRSIYLERSKGNLIAVVTNVNVAAIENLGPCTFPDGINHCAVAVDQAIIDQCNIEKAFGGVMTFTINTALGYTSANSGLGWKFQGNAHVTLPKKCELTQWRTWFPDTEPTEQYGALFSGLSRLEILARSAPTGMVVFPKIIDARVPVVLNDVNDERWIGMFLPSSLDTETGEITVYSIGAKYPGWL